MSDFIPNSFQVPNVLIDRFMRELTAKELVCVLFVIRKTRGWNKNEDAIAVSQFQQATGIARKNTLLTILNNLVEKGLIEVVKTTGKPNKYSLGQAFNRLQLVPVAVSATGGSNSTPPVALSATATSGTKCHPQKTIKNTKQNTLSACELFIENYPERANEKEIKKQWPKLNQESDLNSNIELIINDIKDRLMFDRKWINGYWPAPLKYLKTEHWLNDIVKPRNNDATTEKPEWAKLPTDDNALMAWAKKYDYAKPNLGQGYYEYRGKLMAAIELRLKSA